MANFVIQFFTMKKLLIVTGAGTLLEFGMSSIGEINELFGEWTKEVILLKDDKSKSLYRWVKNKLKSCSFKTQTIGWQYRLVSGIYYLQYCMQKLLLTNLKM
jgi:hypothetical protein